jgi:hypothetical protein
MKARAIGFALLIAASAAWGQNASPKASKETAASRPVQHAKPIMLPLTGKPTSATPHKPVTGSAVAVKPAPKEPAPVPNSATKPRILPASKPVTATPEPKALRKVVRRKSTPVTTDTAAQPATPAKAVITGSAKRDPFISVIRSGGLSGPGCAVGKKCLVADQVTLRGVVKSADGFIAVVENQQRRVYFLREGDPIFNGQVVKIMSDSILFREKTIDKVGKEHTREIAKRIPVMNEPLAVFSNRPAKGGAPSLGPALLSPLTNSDTGASQ